MLALLLVGVFFRLWKLDTIPGVNGDEAWLGWKAFEFARNGKLDWITNSGNLTSPFYILPLAALHKIFTPSVELLRAVSVMSGLLVLPVNFLFCRKVYDLRTAWASTLLLALLPMNIVYSRFGWEPSQIVLFSLPVLYFSLWFCGSGNFFPSGLVLIAASLFFGLPRPSHHIFSLRVGWLCDFSPAYKSGKVTHCPPALHCWVAFGFPALGCRRDLASPRSSPLGNAREAGRLCLAWGQRSLLVEHATHL